MVIQRLKYKIPFTQQDIGEEILVCREFITNTSYRMEVLWVATIGLKILSEVEYKIVYRSCCRIDIIPPNHLQNVLPGHYFSFMLH